MADATENAELGIEFIELAGKGVGMVAKRNFGVGDIVLREHPLIWMPLEVFEAENDRTERWLDRKLNSMSCQDRSDFYDLSDCRAPADKTTLGLFFTNCMNFVDESAALFPKMARANHSCQPNTEFLTRPELKVQDLVAVKPIAKGAEITLSYLPAFGEGSADSETRKAYLREWYGFECVCLACSKAIGDADRRAVRKMQERGLDNLDLYQLEELVDGLDRISSKVDHRDEMNRKLYDKAVRGNDRVVAFKSFSSVYMYKSIKSCPEIDCWKTDFENSQSVDIGGQWYLFPPDNVQ